MKKLTLGLDEFQNRLGRRSSHPATGQTAIAVEGKGHESRVAWWPMSRQTSSPVLPVDSPHFASLTLHRGYEVAALLATGHVPEPVFRAFAVQDPAQNILWNEDNLFRSRFIHDARAATRAGMHGFIRKRQGGVIQVGPDIGVNKLRDLWIDPGEPLQVTALASEVIYRLLRPRILVQGSPAELEWSAHWATGELGPVKAVAILNKGKTLLAATTDGLKVLTEEYGGKTLYTVTGTERRMVTNLALLSDTLGVRRLAVFLVGGDEPHFMALEATALTSTPWRMVPENGALPAFVQRQRIQVVPAGPSEVLIASEDPAEVHHLSLVPA